MIKSKSKIIGISVCFASLFWLIDGIIGTVLFNRGTFLDSLIYNVPKHEFYMRISVVVLFLIFGIIVLKIFNRLEQTEEVLKKQTKELVRSNAELEQFAYVASHDLQEPLRIVSSYVQLIARRYKDKLDADANDFIGYAVDGANRMQILINDLLTYSRIGMHGKDFEPTDCEAVLKRTLDSLQLMIKETGAIVKHDPLPTIIADDLQLGQLFQNLISNAIKFRNEQPPYINISVEEKTTEWVFAVRDNGIGIDPKYSERIFIIFQRLHNKEKYSGTGIGLAICKKIVERHGGRIWIQSQLGKGATFFFTVPKIGVK